MKDGGGPSVVSGKRSVKRRAPTAKRTLDLDLEAGVGFPDTNLHAPLLDGSDEDSGSDDGEKVVFQVAFEAGPLGIKFADERGKFVILEASRPELEPGDLFAMIDGVPVDGLTKQEAGNLIRKSRRPLTIAFHRPVTSASSPTKRAQRSTSTKHEIVAPERIPSPEKRAPLPTRTGSPSKRTSGSSKACHACGAPCTFKGGLFCEECGAKT
jgi:hypothetical protein